MFSCAIPGSIKMEIRHLANLNVVDSMTKTMTAPFGITFFSMYFKADGEIKHNPDALKAARRP